MMLATAVEAAMHPGGEPPVPPVLISGNHICCVLTMYPNEPKDSIFDDPHQEFRVMRRKKQHFKLPVCKNRRYAERSTPYSPYSR